MGWLETFLSGLGAALSAFGAWWATHQRERAKAVAQASADAIAHDPAGEWLRRYNPDSPAASPPDPEEPDAND